MKSWTKRVALVLLGLSGIAVVMMTYRLQLIASTDNFTQLVSADREAFLVVRSSRVGYRRNLLRAIADEIAAAFGTEPTDMRTDVLGVKLTATGFERQVLNDVTTGTVGIVDDRAYMYVKPRVASDADFRLLRLTDMRRASVDEEQRVRAAGGLFSTGSWSSYTALLHKQRGESRYNLSVGGQPWAVIAHNNRSSEGWTAIDVQKGEEPPQRVWYVNVRPRRATASEYDTFLGQQPK